MKKKVKKRLKEDEFVTTVNKLVQFARERTQLLVSAALVIILIVVAFLVSNAIRNQNLKKESQILSQILQLSTEVKEAPEKLPELEALAGKGKFSRVAYLQLAAYWFEREDYEKVRSYLVKMPGKEKDLFYYQARNLMAEIHFQNKEYDEALKIYEQIENENPKGFVLDVVFYQKAKIYEEQGKTEEALALYKRLQEEFAQTYYGYEAADKIRELEEKK